MSDTHAFSINISGMSCGACVASVEKVASRIDAVDHIAVNLALSKAHVELKFESEVSKSQKEVVQAIEQAGFGAKIIKNKPVLIGQAKKQLRQQRNRVAFALILALPTLYLSMFADDMGETAGLNTRLLLAMIATTLVYFWSGWAFHSRAWASLRNRTANMDVLVHLGTTVAFVWSVLLTLAPLMSFLPAMFSTSNHVFYDGVVFIIGFILLGNWM